MVVTAWSLNGSEFLVDVGAASNQFSFAMAISLPAGRVVAMDVEPEMIQRIHPKAKMLFAFR